MGNRGGSGFGALVTAQGINERSATQMHRLGTKVVRGDRVFKYVKSLANITGLSTACWSKYHQDIMYAALPTASPIGSSDVYVTIAATDGIANNGTIAAHELQGGYIVIFHATGVARNYAILDNNAAVSGGTLTITLDGELAEAVVAADVCEVMGSQYRIDWNAVSGGQYRAFIGLPMALLTTTYPYGWVQTWGPCWLAPQTSVGINYQNNLIFRADGSLGLPQDEFAEDCEFNQHAGYCMTRNQAGTGQGAPFIMLECSR